MTSAGPDAGRSRSTSLSAQCLSDSCSPASDTECPAPGLWHSLPPGLDFSSVHTPSLLIPTSPVRINATHVPVAPDSGPHLGPLYEHCSPVSGNSVCAVSWEALWVQFCKPIRSCTPGHVCSEPCSLLPLPPPCCLCLPMRLLHRSLTEIGVKSSLSKMASWSCPLDIQQAVLGCSPVFVCPLPTC